MAKSLKIVLLSYHNQNGGAGIACGRLRDALEKAGHQVSMLVQEKSGYDASIPLNTTLWQKALAWIYFIWERLTYLPSEKSKAVRFLFNPGIYGRDISRHPLIQEADIIHLHWVNFGMLSIQNIHQLLGTGKPIYWTLHDMWTFTGGCHHSGNCMNFQHSCGNCLEFMKLPSENDLSHQLWTKKFDAFQAPNLHIITCSDWLKNRATSSSILKNHRIESIPNAIDTAQFRPAEKHNAKHKLGLNPDKKYILFVAMRVNAPKKGFHYLQEALKNLDSEQYELIIAGNAQDIPELSLKAHKLGHISSPEKMIQVYQAADVFVTPSLEENLPNTIMEALACGTPCVGFNIGGIPEMIEHQVNGYVANYQSVEDLHHGLLWTLENAPEQAARQKAESAYSESIIAAKHLKYYEHVG
jgi:glycosyltransferase involved in cell wall biosynthesis